jgi:MFS transporter, DHA3 family, macrolide efflux protein
MKAIHKFAGMRNFLILWTGQSVSSLGSAMTNFALILWAYGKQGTASSITSLSFFTYLPSILFCFVAGTLADKWDKKRIMLVSDLTAAMGTLTVFILYGSGQLQIWHLYGINFLISCMNAFQCPASYVALSLLVPKEQYLRASGLQVFSNSLVTVVTPALATAILAIGGLKTVLTFDLATFTFAFVSLSFFIRIPAVPYKEEKKEKFLKSCLQGLGFLREHSPVLKMILFFSFINLLAYMTGFGILPAMILKRSGDSQVALSMVSSAVGLGTLAGSILVTLLKPGKNRTRVIFGACAISFLLCDILWALGRNVPIWVFAAFVGNLPLPFLNANLSTVMRTKVPTELQGRVFSTRDTIQYCTIPLGLFLGGYLADNVFEPFMAGSSSLSQFLSCLVGTGKGAGMAVMFLITGVIGLTSSLLSLKSASLRSLDS